MKLFTIWDIDNCISDDHWRQPMIEWNKQGDERYHEYNAQACNDELKHAEVFRTFASMGAEPVFFSGRPEYMRELTLAWQERMLSPHGLPTNPKLYLRANGTVGLPPRACKEAMLRQFFAEHMYPHPGARVIAAFDDIPAIVQMYREANIPAAVLAIHEDLSGAYSPNDLV